MRLQKDSITLKPLKNSLRSDYMNTKPLLSGASLIEIEKSRYDELLRKEERLTLLESAICKLSYTSDVKKTFSIEEKNNGKTS